MNFKSHKKGLIALALVFFMIAPMFAAVNFARASTDTAVGTFSVYQQGTGGTTNVNSVTVGSNPNPIGTNVYFDIYISSAQNVWAWVMPTVTWNPAVLQLTQVVEGPWLKNNVPGGDPTDFSGGASSLFDNTHGDINGGLAEAIVGSDQAATSAGVVATLRFQISGYGTSSINIAGTTLADNSVDNTNQVPATANNDASITVLAPPLSISLVPHGATSGSIITMPSNQNPIGSTFQVDAYIAGAVGNIWGWNLGISWNNTVLNMTGLAEGSYLNGGVSGATFFVPGSIDNVDGTIQGGVSDALNAYTTSSAGAGVLMSMTFQIQSFGSCNIQLSQGTPFTLLNSAYPHQAVTYNGNPPTLNALTYSWTPLPPQSPTANIVIPNSPLGNGVDATLIGFPITLDGATSSLPGTNTQPPGQNCPITAYSWSITLVNGTIVTATTPTVALSSALIGGTAGTITATLTVTAPSPTNTPATTYVDIGTKTIAIQVQTPAQPGVLDIWTQNGGQGSYINASSFGPQQLVDIYAYVSYNGAPVVNKTVTFNVYLNGAYQSYTTAQSDQNGIAVGSYRLPWQDVNPAQYFGQMTINGSVDIAQVILTDSCSFYYGYQLNLNSVVITNGAGSPPTFNRYFGNNTVLATVTVTNTMWNSTSFWLAATIYDNNNVPVAQFLMQETAPAAASGGWANTNTQTYNISLTIPSWAYVGTATLYVNIFDSNPQQNGVAWSPQKSAPMAIMAGPTTNPLTNIPTEVLDISYAVQNDEDTGRLGNWALDNYVKTMQVWSLGSNQYEIVTTYSGTFTTYNGALSPQAGTPEQTGPNGLTGTMQGGYIATFNATSFNPNSLVATGNTGITYNFGGTRNDVAKGTYGAQTGDSNVHSVLSDYFPGYTGFNYLNWGWTYTYTWSSGSTSVWNNDAAGNTGDIVV